MKNKTLSSYFSVMIVSSGFLFGCSDEKLPEFTNLNKLRVIALVASSPEVNPGAPVTITPWVSDITETTGLTDSVAVCLDPGVSFGASPSCDGNPSKLDIRTNYALTITGSNFTGSVQPADAFVVNIPLDAVIFANKTAAEQWNGVSYLIDYRLKNSSGVELKSIRRILVSTSTKTTKNANPVLTDILANSTTMTALPVGGATVSLSTDLNASSIESYTRINSDGNLETFSENVSVTWMITDGETKYARTGVGDSVTFTGPAAAPTGRQFHLFAVARDDRGGVSVIKKEF